MLTSNSKCLLGIAAGAALVYKLWPRADRLFPGQVAIITGGSRGLGLALAHQFGKAGLRLMLAARGEDELHHAQQALLDSGSVSSEGDVHIFACDLTHREQAAALIDATIERFGRLDVLINNAGIIEVGPAEAQPIEAYQQAIAVDFMAAVYTVYSALPHLLAKRNGAIVNIASIGGKFAVPHMLPYVAAKFALTGFSEGLHAELLHKGIRVTTVCPGLMRTGGESHAHFVGQIEKEKAWFEWSARTPFIAVEVSRAARQILNAVNIGKTELIISPQAWLAARFQGIAPETTQAIAALVNQYLLPSPRPSGQAAKLADSLLRLAR